MRQGHENQEEEKKKTCLVHSLTLCMRIFVSQWVGTWWHILTVAKNRSLWKHYASHSCGNTRKSKPWRKCKLSAREVHLYRYVQSHSCQKQEMFIEDWNMQWPWNVLEEQQRDYSLYSSYGCALDFVPPPSSRVSRHGNRPPWWSSTHWWEKSGVNQYVRILSHSLKSELGIKSTNGRLQVWLRGGESVSESTRWE